jgi:hypothetical protein
MTDTAAIPPSSPPGSGRRRLLVRGALVLVAAFLLIQLVPYGRDHTNPAPSKAVALPTAPQRAIFAKACADCHSYDTKWLWYTNVAPVSWLVQNDVDGGRERLNLSAWDRPQPGVDDVVEAIEGGEMPPLKYTISPYHFDARLSDAEKRQLVAGFRALYAAQPPPGEQRGGG